MRRALRYAAWLAEEAIYAPELSPA